MQEGDLLYITPKMGIIPEVTKQNYETIAKQLREPITNSLDANAKNVYITIQPDEEYTNLIISDDGDGMSEKDFNQQYLALGGSDMYYKENKIGRIGIGFLACAPLCESMEIHSRKKGINTAFIAELDVKVLLDKSKRLETIQDFPVGRILKIYEDADSIGLDKHYTRIVLKKLNTEVINVLNDKERYDDLKAQLRKILPLTFPDNCKLFEFISDDLKQILIEESKKYNINVIFNNEKLIKRVYGEDPKNERFKVVMELIREKVGRGVVSGYFVDNYLRIKTWNGLITRFQNVTVEDSGFLGWHEKPAALPRITGELFISGLDKNLSISINRNSFNEAYEDYIKLRNLIYEKLQYFTTKHYRRTYISSAINIEIKKKTDIKKNLKKISQAISKPKKKKPKIQKKIVKKPIKKRKATDLSEIKIGKRYGEVEVKAIDKVPKEGRSKKQYTIEWKGEDGINPVVYIEKKLLRESVEPLEIENEQFKIFFIEDEEELNPCKIDFNKNEVIFNILHPALKKKNEKIISFIFLLTYYYDKTKTKEEYRNKIIDSLTEIGD